MAVITFKADSTTLILNDEVINDFINGDILELAPVNPDTSRTYGRNRSVNIQKRSDADVYTLKFSVMKDSDSDIFMNTQMNKDIPVVFAGSLKEIFIKDGSEFTESYELSAGSITDKPTQAKNNQDGNAQMDYTVELFARRLI